LRKHILKGKGGKTRHHETNFGVASSTAPVDPSSVQGSDAVHVSVGASASPIHMNEYAELKRVIKQQSLLDKQPAYYAGKIVLTLGLLVPSLTFLLIFDNLWLQLLNAALLAFVFVQISLVAHDFGHRQFSIGAGWKNECLALVLGNLLLGISQQWWIDKHNEHHSHPNQLDLDPDIDIPLIAFTEEQALSKQGIARFIVKYQAYLLFPLSLLQALSMRFSSIQFLVVYLLRVDIS
jgi:fatty acid desaturase